MTIKQVTLEEVPHIVPLFDAYRVWYGKESAPERASDFLSQRLNHRESIIYSAMMNESQYVGFTQLYPLFSSTRMGRLWLLNDLYVEPSFRGRGISKALIERAKRLCRETNAVGMMLETEKSNFIGNKLYPGTGFVLEDAFNHYFWQTH